VRIAVVVGSFPKLSETWILAQVTGLLERGHEIDIYARRRPEEGAVHPAVLRYGLQARTTYFDLPDRRFPRLTRGIGALGRMLLRHPMRAARAVNPLRYRSAYAMLNNLVFVEPFLRTSYDAVLCHFGGNGADFIVVKDAMPEVRYVTMFHGDDYLIPDELGPRAFAALRSLGDAFLVATDCFGRDRLRRHGFEDARIVTLRLAIAAKEVPFRERSREGPPVRVLSVGRLVEKKGLESGIRAMAALRRARPDIELEYVIVGDGPLREPLQELVVRQRLRETVRFLGALPGPEVMQQMQQADVYYLPSLMEQAGYVLLEAQASGLPVVATRVGGVSEMVREGRSAVLIPPADTEAAVAAFASLLDHPEQWGAMSRAGREYVEEEFDGDRLAAALEKVLEGSTL
jgi:colanic acid/amylovoran biosynthesis glycosyltransferase